MADLIDAIKAIEPSAEISISNEDWDTIIWHNISPMDKDTVLAKQEELKTASPLKGKVTPTATFSFKSKGFILICCPTSCIAIY